MKKVRELNKIKNGKKVMDVLSAPRTFQDIQNMTFLSRDATQKALANLQKNGYICKNEKSMWIISPGVNVDGS